MSSLPELTCSLLAEPLSSGDPFRDTGGEPALDHVCIETMCASIDTAMRDGVIPRSEWWPVTDRTARDGGRRRLAMILRQWVEDDDAGGRRRLAKLLSGMDDWRRLVVEVRRASRPQIVTDDHVRLAQKHGRQDIVGREGTPMPWLPAPDWKLAERLRLAGLPDTPSTVAHLRAVATGLDEPLPAHGLLVTTFVYVRTLSHPEQTAFASEFAPPHRVEVSGQLGRVRHELWRKVASVATTHEEWLASLTCPDFSSIQALRTSFKDPNGQPEPGSVNYDLLADRAPIGWLISGLQNERVLSTDYLEEALAQPEFGDHLRTLRAMRYPDGRPTCTTQYLNRVEDRIGKRLQRRGLPTTPPPGWRDEFREIEARCLAEAAG